MKQLKWRTWFLIYILMQSTSFDLILPFLTNWKQKIVIVDVESTGGDLYLDRLTEVALICIENGQLEERSWLINPQKSIPIFVENLTGIKNGMVKNQPVFANVATEIKQYLEGAILIAHNVHFDYSFLRHAFLRENIYIQNHVLCSVKLSRKLYPDLRKHNLDSIIERMNIQLPSRHRALPDAQAILVFLAKSLNTLSQDVLCAQMNALLAPATLPEQLPLSVLQTVAHLPDDFGFYVFLDQDRQPLFSKACERVFSSCCDELSRLKAELLVQVAYIEYCSSFGLLSAQIELALWREMQGMKAEKQGVSVVLEKDEKGYLQVKIIPLLFGSEKQACFGYFPNPKAAKRALFDCVKEQHLCANTLGLTQPTPLAGTACGQESLGQCLGACVGREVAESHNLRAQRAFSKLPVKDWHFANPIQLTETHPISGLSVSYVFHRGRLLREGHAPFFHAALLPIIKKQMRANSKITINQLDVDSE